MADHPDLQQLRADGVTLEEVGQELGVTRERVQQLEARALAKGRAWCDWHKYRIEDLLG
jgi:DNA-directed RNA polymerase sigma subunit (sigma70/sigma32)